MPAANEIGKLIPLRNIHGISKNMGKDGKTYQKVPEAWDAILATSTFSPYIQHIPKTEMSGSEAIKLASKGSFFEISDTATMITAVTKIFTQYQTIKKNSNFLSPRE